MHRFKIFATTTVFGFGCGFVFFNGKSLIRTKKLEAASSSSIITSDDLVLYCDRSMVAANNPCEDFSDIRVSKAEDCHMDQLGNRVCSKTTTTAKNDDPSTYDNDTVLLAGVFDGHGGSRASEFVKTNLFNSIEKQIVKDHQKSRKKHKKHLSLGEVLGFTMRNVDEAFKASVLEEFLDGNWKLANVGTCAIISAITKSNIYIANCGDCRAVLAIRKKDSLVPIQLSNDHNAREVSEQKLLQSAHSDEHNVVVQFGENPYYVKGVLQCTRSIGDYYLKDSTFNKHPMPNIFVVPEPYHPPYVTSNPEVSTIPRDNNQAFLVLASDGLYDELSNSEVIKIVENWLHLPVEEKSKISSSQMLIDAALKNASKETEVPLEIIKSMPCMFYFIFLYEFIFVRNFVPNKFYFFF